MVQISLRTLRPCASALNIKHQTSNFYTAPILTFTLTSSLYTFYTATNTPLLYTFCTFYTATNTPLLYTIYTFYTATNTPLLYTIYTFYSPLHVLHGYQHPSPLHDLHVLHGQDQRTPSGQPSRTALAAPTSGTIPPPIRP